jgi:hypothetical protein
LLAEAAEQKAGGRLKKHSEGRRFWQELKRKKFFFTRAA